MEASEEDMKQIATDVAAGVVTPAPRLSAWPSPGIASAARSTPAPMILKEPRKKWRRDL